MIRFINAAIMRLENDTTVEENMQLWVEDGKISFLGTMAEGNEAYSKMGSPKCEVKDCGGNLLMPGFKNAHTHSAMVFLRSKADGLSLHDWLNQVVFPAEAKLSAEDIKEFTRLAVLEYLQSGVTGIMDMYLTPDTVAEACVEMGMRLVLTGGVNNFSQSVEEMESWILKYRDYHELVSFIPGFHAEYTCDKELLCKISQLANRYQLPVYAHISETEEEVDGCRSRYGMTPFAFLDSLDMFRCGGGGYHLVHVTEEELILMKERGVYAITNPASNLKLSSGIAKVGKWLEHGIPVAIGTDGAASNNALDFFREMYLVATLGNVTSDSGKGVSAADVLKMACHTGADALGIPESNCLAVGKNADIIMIDLHQPNMQPIFNIPENIVYSGSKINVMMTMIAGRILYEDYEFIYPFSKKDIYATCAKRCEKIERG